MPEATTVGELAFSELYLGHATLEDRYAKSAGADLQRLPAGAALRADLDLLAGACKAALQGARNQARCKVTHGGVAYHMAMMQTAGGAVFVLRKIAERIYSLAELGLPSAYIRRLAGSSLSGLLIVAGAGKAGKTTTACALVRERLLAFGGVAVTGEDLVELPLEGSHGRGVCYQTVNQAETADFPQRFRNVLGSGAQIVLLDEIRDHDSAAAALRASVDGRLIISTMLAENVAQGLARLEALASERMSQSAARGLMADGLVAVLHQRIVRGPKNNLDTELLFLKDTPVTQATLRSGRYDLLAPDIKRQMAAMIAANAAPQRASAE